MDYHVVIDAQFSARLTGEWNMANTNATEKKTPAVEAIMTRGEDGKPIGIHLTFGGTDTLAVALSQLNDEMRMMCMVHGLKQKLVDAAAISRNPDTGRSASIKDKFDAVSEVAERLLNGQWNKTREGGSGGGKGGLLFAALVRMYAGRMDEEAVRAWLGEKTDKEQAALRKNPKVAEIIEEIKAERAKDGTADASASDDLLAELDMLGAGE